MVYMCLERFLDQSQYAVIFKGNYCLPICFVIELFFFQFHIEFVVSVVYFDTILNQVLHMLNYFCVIFW